MRVSTLLCLALLASAAEAQVASPEAPVSNPDGSVCTALDSVRACLVRAGDDEVVAVTESGRETARYPTGRFFGSMQSDIRTFRVEDRFIVATLDGASNGLAFTTWTLGVLPPGATRPSYTFQVNELGLNGGSFAAHRGRSVVWATEWAGMPDPAGRHGWGTYLVGRPFYVEVHRLVPAADLPIRARRLLRSFSIGEGGPVDWLSGRRAETLRVDPRLLGSPAVTPGRIVSADDRGDRGLWLTVETEAGERLVLSSVWDEKALPFEHIGDGETGRLLPVDYRAGALRLDGRRIRIEARDKGRVVWFDRVAEP